MLEIRDLHAAVAGEPILKGLNLTVNAGEVHAIMGPNGSGKSTLANVLAGKDNYEITGGDALFEGRAWPIWSPRSARPAGAVPGVPVPGGDPRCVQHGIPQGGTGSHPQGPGQGRWDSVTLLRKARETCKQVDLDPQFLKRGVNEGFSGGEKKRNEIMQMLLMEPKLALLDETDSGLDIDALQTVARGSTPCAARSAASCW